MMAGETDFQVRIASTGQLIGVAKDESVLEALRGAGIDVPNSCQQGVCGTCLTHVLEGEPEHWDMFLTPEEQEKNDRFLPCCSRSKTPVLVLDL